MNTQTQDEPKLVQLESGLVLPFIEQVQSKTYTAGAKSITRKDAIKLFNDLFVRRASLKCHTWNDLEINVTVDTNDRVTATVQFTKEYK